MKIKIIKNSIVFIAVAIMLASTQNALAYVPGVWDPQPRFQANEAAFTKIPNPYDAPVVVQRTTVVNNKTVSNTSSSATTTNTKKVSATTVNKTTNNTNTDINSNKLVPTVNTDENANNLAALSLNGSQSFMPSTLWQWLLVVLLIFAIIIIARRLSKKTVEHNPHAPVPAH
jgi:hypothetical protein